MNLNFLPKKILDSISNFDLDKLYQIRFRKNFPVRVVFDNKLFYLKNNGLTNIEKNSIICENEDLMSILDNITEHSIYAYNDKIIKGYITTEDGVRVGIGGECVFDNTNIIAIKNITSLNVRIPHLINNCSLSFLKYFIKDNEVLNTLIISPAFCGKTTILKDIAKQINNMLELQILLIDERGEFSTVSGKNIDSIKFSNKKFAFENGLRSLSPNIVITDELSIENDWQFAKIAVNSGVKIIASCHANSIDNIFSKPNFEKGIFDRYILLKIGKFGVINQVLDKDFNEL